MTRPVYMHEPWFALMVAGAKQSSRSQLARLLGVCPATVSQVLNGSGKYGSGEASTAHVAVRVVHTLGRYPCPHLTAEAGGEVQTISAEQCRALAHRPAPTASPRAMQHWQACHVCPHKAASTPLDDAAGAEPRKPHSAKRARVLPFQNIKG